MGQRANLVIVKPNGYELYYNHWCANTLPRDLFFGSQHAIPFIEAQSKVDDSGWLDNIWAEGGVLIDEQRKLVLFYGGEDELMDIPYRRLFLKLMQKVWIDWELRWAKEGILEIADYVGVAKEKVLVNKKDDLSNVSLDPPEDMGWVDTMASIKFEDGEILIFPLYGGIEGYLLNGSQLIDKFDKLSGYKQYSLDEGITNFPNSGFHVDVVNKQIDIWHAEVLTDIAKRVDEIWGNWEIRQHYDKYEIQIEKTAGNLQFPFVDPNRLLLEIKASLLRAQVNPLDTLASVVKRLGQEDKNVEVSPYAYKHENYELPEKIRESIIQDAISALGMLQG